jgi:hypothetical protein
MDAQYKTGMKFIVNPNILASHLLRNSENWNKKYLNENIEEQIKLLTLAKNRWNVVNE